MDEQKVAPVKEGEQYEVYVNSVGSKGDGIAKVKGFVLFVANTQAGDFVKVKITKVLQNVGFAQVVEKLEKPPEKVRKKFATFTEEELNAPEKEEFSSEYEDTEDF